MWILVDLDQFWVVGLYIDTPSISNYITYNFLSKSDFVKFNYIYHKVYILNFYNNENNVIRIIIKYIFILYIFGIYCEC
jgi:hypothetical protein